MKEMKKLIGFLCVLTVAMLPAVSQAHSSSHGGFHGGHGGEHGGWHGGGEHYGRGYGSWYHGPHRSWRGHDVVFIGGVWGYWSWDGFGWVWIPTPVVF
jgi:hypothetical protein